jgi:hypothetical protein
MNPQPGVKENPEVKRVQEMRRRHASISGFSLWWCLPDFWASGEILNCD